MAQTQPLERTKPYLRPNQIDSIKREQARQSAMLNAPPHIAVAVDKNLARQTLQRIETQLREDAPKAYEGADRDKAVKRESELRDAFTTGMPTQAEMRKAPAGAIEKHMAWERRNSQNIDEWKNIRLRMHASGMLPSEFEGSAIANIEMFRPAGGPGELNMDSAQVPGKQFSLGNVDSTPFNDFELALLQKLAPSIAGMAVLLTADQRREIKTALAAQAEIAATPVPIDALDFKAARERCRALGIETSGSHDVLLTRLREHADELARAAG